MGSESFDFYIDDTVLLSKIACDDRRGKIDFQLDDGSSSKVFIFIDDAVDSSPFELGATAPANQVEWSESGGSIAQFGTYAAKDLGGDETEDRFGAGTGEFFKFDLAEGGFIQGRISVTEAYPKNNAGFMTGSSSLTGSLQIDFFATCAE
jgi:hypothetical protein